MTYTVRALKQAAYNAGFRGHNLVIAVAVSLAENGARDEKATHRNSDGSTDYGAWQINSVHGFTGNPFDLQTNANMAYTVYRSQGWRAWTVFKSGAYKPKLARAQRAKLAPTGTGGDDHRPSQGGATSSTGGAQGVFGHQGDNDTSDIILGGIGAAADGLVNPIRSIDDLAGAIADPALWKRIGLGAVAVLVILAGVLVMLSSNKNVRSIEKVAAVL